MTPAGNDGFASLPPDTRLRMLLALHGLRWMEMAQAVTRDLQYAEDAVSEALAALAAEWSNGPGPDDPVAWTTAVVRNQALKRCAKEQSQHRLTVRLHDERSRDNVHRDQAAPEGGMGCEEVAAHREKVREVLPSLPGQQAEVLRMRLLEDKSPAEIARHLECSEGAVRVAQHKAVKSLRKWLDRKKPTGDE